VTVTSGRQFDWAGARRRLEASAEVDIHADISRAREILDERARRLSVAPSPVVTGDWLALLTFELASTHFAIEQRFVHEVVRLNDLTPVPGTPASVAGVTNHRGRILCLFDLRNILGLPTGPTDDLARIVVLGEQTVEYGVLVERTNDTASISVAALHTLPDAMVGGDSGLCQGITRDGLIVLDGRALQRDRRFVIDVEAEADPRPAIL
jgi:purine-binding chemotaxis protein CheW